MLQTFHHAAVLAATLLITGSPSWAAPAYRALLVGVSEYPSLKKELQLHGPRNDVQRMRDLLIQRGVPAASIAVLADGVPGADLPTRQRIMDRLDDLARTAKPGDYIIVHLGGHGSQQPVGANSPYARDEPDGLFEIFLPRDVAGWTNAPAGGDAGVKNAIVDHEIRAVIDRMTAAGAFVWAIFDTCHSATMVRSAASNDEVRMRQVMSTDLGIPPEVMDRASPRLPAARPAGDSAAAAPAPARQGPRGQAVYFYAAQSYEPAPEMRLPLGSPDRQAHGLFSHVITQALEGGAGMTYAQLSQQVMANYRTMAEARSTPAFSGTALDQPVLGQPAPPVRQWRLLPGPDLKLAAGTLSDVNEGAIFAILPSAVAPIDKALGHARVTKAELNTAQLVPVDHAGRPKAPAATLATGSFARLVSAAPSLRLSVATDLAGCSKPCPFDGPVKKLQAASSSAGDPLTLPPIDWMASRQGAHLRLHAVGRRLWLLPASLDALPSCDRFSSEERQRCERDLQLSLPSVAAEQANTEEGLYNALVTALRSAAKVEGLLKVASIAGTSAYAQQVTTQITVKRGDAASVPISGKPLRCAPAPTGAAAVSTASDTCLRPDDKVLLEIANKGINPVDVTVLYVDGLLGISPLFPTQGGLNRLEPGAVLKVDPIQIVDSTLGLERLLVFAVEAATRQAERVDLSFVAQAALPAHLTTRSATRGESSTSIFESFMSASFPEVRTRGVAPPAIASQVGSQVFVWQVKR